MTSDVAADFAVSNASRPAEEGEQRHDAAQPRARWCRRLAVPSRMPSAATGFSRLAAGLYSHHSLKQRRTPSADPAQDTRRIVSSALQVAGPRLSRRDRRGGQAALIPRLPGHPEPRSAQ